MKNYQFKATNLIAEKFEQHEVKFDVRGDGTTESVLAGFSVDCGPDVVVAFISADNDNDVAIRVFRYISNTPKEKRSRIIEVCNLCNTKDRHLKFVLDFDGDVNVEYDLPIECTDDCVGDIAFEIFVRIMRILEKEYKLFMRAIITNDDIFTESEEDEKREALKLLRKMLEASLSKASENPDETDCVTV